MKNNELSLLDILNILSFIVGLQNLELNEKQSNDLQKHLSSQDDILIKEQNEMLKKLINQNNEIISLLKRK